MESTLKNSPPLVNHIPVSTQLGHNLPVRPYFFFPPLPRFAIATIHNFGFSVPNQLAPNVLATSALHLPLCRDPSDRPLKLGNRISDEIPHIVMVNDGRPLGRKRDAMERARPRG